MKQSHKRTIIRLRLYVSLTRDSIAGTKWPARGHYTLAVPGVEEEEEEAGLRI